MVACLETSFLPDADCYLLTTESNRTIAKSWPGLVLTHAIPIAERVYSREDGISILRADSHGRARISALESALKIGAHWPGLRATSFPTLKSI